MDAVETAMYSIVPFWHKKGNVLDHIATSEEALDKSGLSWQVNLHSLTTVEGLPISTHKAVVRDTDSSILGVVGAGYVPRQNVDAFKDMDKVLQVNGASYESAGSLRGGKQVWLLARMPEDIKVAGQDTVYPYVLISNSHDSSQKYRVLPTTVRAGCLNTVTLALIQGANMGFAGRHTKNLESRIDEYALGMVEKIEQSFTDFEANANKLIELGVTDPEQVFKVALDLYFQGQDRSDKDSIQVKRYDEAFTQMLSNLSNDLNRPYKDNGWGVLNAVTEWADHSLTYRGADKEDNRFESIVSGRAAEVKEAVFATLLKRAA